VDSHSAESGSNMTLLQVHPGGYFWHVHRAAREAHLLRLVSETGRLVLITNSAREAIDFSERLTLSGVPVLVAIDTTNVAVVDAFNDDQVSTLIATQEYVIANGPIEARLVVHLRTSPSVRDYERRIGAALAPVHVTFIVPEDERRVVSLLSHLKADTGHGEPTDVEFEDVVDLRSADDFAMVAHARRRIRLRG
jgi:hypothetical protein